jgi:hypothetical protein
MISHIAQISTDRDQKLLWIGNNNHYFNFRQNLINESAKKSDQ